MNFWLSPDDPTYFCIFLSLNAKNHALTQWPLIFWACALTECPSLLEGGPYTRIHFIFDCPPPHLYRTDQPLFTYNLVAGTCSAKKNKPPRPQIHFTRTHKPQQFQFNGFERTKLPLLVLHFTRTHKPQQFQFNGFERTKLPLLVPTYTSPAHTNPNNFNSTGLKERNTPSSSPPTLHPHTQTPIISIQRVWKNETPPPRPHLHFIRTHEPQQFQFNGFERTKLPLLVPTYTSPAHTNPNKFNSTGLKKQNSPSSSPPTLHPHTQTPTISIQRVWKTKLPLLVPTYTSPAHTNPNNFNSTALKERNTLPRPHLHFTRTHKPQQFQFNGFVSPWETCLPFCVAGLYYII